MLLGGLAGAGLLDLSLSALAGVPGALGAGLGAVEGAGEAAVELAVGRGVGVTDRAGGFTALLLVLPVLDSEPTLPADEGRTEPSPLAVRGAGLTEGTFTWLWLLGCVNNAVLTTVVIDVAAEAMSGLGSLTLESTGEPAEFCTVNAVGCCCSGCGCVSC